LVLGRGVGVASLPLLGAPLRHGTITGLSYMKEELVGQLKEIAKRG